MSEIERLRDEISQIIEGTERHECGVTVNLYIDDDNLALFLEYFYKAIQAVDND